MGKKEKRRRKKKPKTNSEELTHPRHGQITRASLIIGQRVPRKDVDI